MRDAFGGAFMIRLFLVFIFIYMFFTAIALNYAKAFKVKNKVIDYLEDNEIMDATGLNAKQYEKMGEYFEKELLGNLNYRVSTSMMDCSTHGNQAYVHLAYCQDGIKITQVDLGDNKSDEMGVYYKVDTYFTWSVPFLRKLLEISGSKSNEADASGVWKISGETRTIINSKK